MSESVTILKLRDKFDDRIIDVHDKLGQDTVTLAKSALLEAARFLRDDPQLKYDMLMDLSAVDYLGRKPRFEVVSHLYSIEFNHRVRIKVPLDGDLPELDSLTPLWKSANWYEREVWDMFGIRFAGHPDLRRILMYEEFEGHPLRKDYAVDKRQPLVGQSE